MKNRILKITVIFVMILSMTMTNFIFVGNSLISYAAENLTTNHKNIEFKAYVKQEEKDFLYLQVNVKKEGYFNGEIVVEHSNFILKQTDSTYVNKIENNTLYLNQINAGTTEEIKVKIEPIKEENFSIGLLNMTSKIKLRGIYRDSTEQDIKIQASREIIVPLVENNTPEDVINEMQVITNKIVEIEGQEKRVLQFSYHMGLKQNNYPIQEIHAQIEVPSMDGKQPEVKNVEYLNNMTTVQYNYEGNNLEIMLRNEANPEGKIMWKAQGSENIIITCIYDANVSTENIPEIRTNQKIILYNGKEIDTQKTTIVGTEEQNAMIEVSAKNLEETIYKGKLNAKIERNYESITQLKVNLAKAINTINITEQNSQDINVTYGKTFIKKEQFDKIMGQNGSITIYDQNGKTIETLTNATPMNEEGNLVIDYEGKNVTIIHLQTTKPIKEGILEFHHSKKIHANGENINQIKTQITNNEKTIETVIQLEESTNNATLAINKETLSTVVANNVEIKAVLTSNNEKYDLYKNPTLTIELPEQVENIQINSINLLYENELQIKQYNSEGRNITISLEGEQTQYKEDAIEGATIIMNTTIHVNRKASTSEEEIKMIYPNKETVQAIKIVAPTDMTTIYNMPELGIETLGQEKTSQKLIQRGTEEKQIQAQIEVINNHEDNMENIKILGDFPTNYQDNNMGIKISGAITLQGIENAKIYYSENNNATDEIEKAENRWQENIENPNTVSKYLIVVDQLATGDSIQGSYRYQIPANLEYNQTAKTGYQVKYTNHNTKVENKMNATTIDIQTGIGPQVETKMLATVGGNEIKGSIRAGEVIQYQIEIANTGTEDAKNVKVVGQVPEGTTKVEPEENYEYTGPSYYQEVADKTFEETIENLKVGEVITKTYEVRVNTNTVEGTTLTNQAEVTYGDVTKTTEAIQNITAAGDLRVTVKRVTDRSIDLYTRGVVKYFAIVENISNQKQEDIKIKTNLPKNLEVEILKLYTEMEKEEEAKFETIEYQEEINIGALEPGETKVLSYGMLINKVQNDNNQINFSVVAKKGQEEYRSNHWQDNVQNVEVDIAMTTNTESQYLKSGDTVEYTIDIVNKSKSKTDGLVIKDTIPQQLTINQITKNGETIQEIEGNEINLPVEIPENKTETIKIEAVVDYSEGREKAEAITNIAYAEIYGEKVATTSEINHIIQANDTDEENNNNNPVEPGEEEGDKKANNTITGIAWFDENANGQKEAGEKLLNNIKVKLLNTEKNEIVEETTTNENGIYILDKIGNGKYIVLFEYDKEQYTVTKYKAEGIEEAENSNVVISELMIKNEKQKVAGTNELVLQNNNLSNINIGLIKLQNFDLKLDKQVSRILIQNAKGTTVKNYHNETMAKVELDAKTISGSTVLIEYKIKVTNQGEVEGYAKKIADYYTTDLKFSSELNKDWYQVGNTLYTASLANEKIKPGETKTVTLTLTKAMTENNTGLMPNTAEIAEDYNELGIEDSNSTPGNKVKGENDMGAADVLLSIRTGEIVFISVGIVVVVILGITAFAIIHIKKKENEKE